MTQPPPGPSAPLPPPSGRSGGSHRAPPARTARPLLTLTLGAVAVLLAGLVVYVAVTQGREAPSPTSGQQGDPAAAAPAPGPTSGGNGAGAASPTAEPGPSDDQKILKLADHPILQDPDAGLKNLACDLPTWRSNQQGAEAFFSAASRCLDRAWGPFLQYYHLPFTPPALHFPTGASFQTDCGTIKVGIATAAYYCENNLYVPFRGLQTDQYGDNPGVYLALFAHEYGHHVQEVAGLMDAAWERIYAVGQNSEAGLEMARRKELQAQCFSGMFLGAHVDRGGSITRDMYAKAWKDQETRGDNTSGSHDHGTNAHYAAWWRTGAQDNRIARCNTFAAPGAEVS
ncbi:neutral zinc metallopeptidase [Amycolatopsis anabasis]|uniref:neutral zinc metallopeptidase n=1 Tax=Amycolatopsis anabasis TaxID=1840409 RepID=UPI00131D0B9C|nr:neutral zinc metallopeptidase [Amycolatopsis anabasis]